MMLTHHAHSLRVDAPRTVEIPPQDDEERHDAFFERFGIDDARTLMSQAHTTPREASVKTFVLRIDFITLEAQNALLKLLEEPPKSSRFLFVLPHDLPLLVTLASRMESIVSDIVEQTPLTFVEFQRATVKDRIAEIERASKQKDLEWQRGIKTGLIAHLKANRGRTHFAELEFVARTLLTRGASNKMLLEHAALLL